MRRIFVAVLGLALMTSRAGAVEIDDLLAPASYDTPRLAESKRILSGNPSDEIALFGLAHGFYEIARYRESVRVYERMIEGGVSRMHYVHSDMAIVLDRLERTAEAEEHFRIAQGIMPTFPHPYAGLATMWLRRGQRLEEAATNLGLAINYETSEDLKNCYRVQLGAARLDMGEVEEAIRILEEARAALPVLLVRENYPINDIEALYEVRYHLARAYRKQGNRAEAERLLEEAVQVYETRRAAPPQARQATMPPGTWEAIEHPDRFRYLFERWKLP